MPNQFLFKYAPPVTLFTVSQSYHFIKLPFIYYHQVRGLQSLTVKVFASSKDGLVIPVQGQVNEALETAIEAEQNPPPGIDLTDLTLYLQRIRTSGLDFYTSKS